MNPELAALLKAYDAFREAAPGEASGLGDAYELMLRNYSERSGIDAERLEQAVKPRYLLQAPAAESARSTGGAHGLRICLRFRACETSLGHGPS